MNISGKYASNSCVVNFLLWNAFKLRCVSCAVLAILRCALVSRGWVVLVLSPPLGSFSLSREMALVHRCRFIEWVPEQILCLGVNADNILAVGRINGDIEIWNPLKTGMYSGKVWDWTLSQREINSPYVENYWWKWAKFALLDLG